jgi:hypothetical protein
MHIPSGILVFPGLATCPARSNCIAPSPAGLAAQPPVSKAQGVLRAFAKQPDPNPAPTLVQRTKYAGTITPGPMPQPGLGPGWDGPSAPPPYPGDIESGGATGKGTAAPQHQAQPPSHTAGWDEGTVVAELVVRAPSHHPRSSPPKEKGGE